MCGDLVYSVEYGAPLASIDGTSSPVKYVNPAFTINSDDEDLIGEVVPYKMTVVFADYQQITAAKYESTNTITYKAPCPLVGDTDLSYTTFTAVPHTFATDAYTTQLISIDIDSLYTVIAEFCSDTITYECVEVTGPDGLGGTKTFTGTDYPATLCELNDSNVLSV